MVNYQGQTTWNPSPNFTPASQVRQFFGRPRANEIVIGHWWGDPNANPTFRGVVNWLCNPRSQVSAHYVVGQGQMAQLVDEDDAAWHARQANPFSIGIEIDPNANDDTYQRVGWLVYDIRKRKGQLPLKGHNVYVSTQCPGHIDLARIDRIANEYANPVPTVPEWQDKMEKVKPQQLKVIVPQAQVYDLRNGSAIKPLGYGTPVDFVAMTRVGNQEYYISSYSFSHGLPNGMRKQDVGIIPEPAPTPAPVPPPPLATIPEYKDKTIDTPDVRMYAKVDTSLFNFETGRLEGAGYKRGQLFDIAAETSFAGKRYGITVYSFGKKVWKGIPLDDLQLTPPVDPPKPSPEQQVDLEAVKRIVLAINALWQKLLELLKLK